MLYKTYLSQEDWLEEDAYLSGDNVLYGFEHKNQAEVALLPDFAVDGTQIKALGNNSFKECYRLVSVDLPSSLLSVGEQAFYDCRRLSSVYLPSSLKHIGRSAFREDRNLLSIFIPPC